MKYLIASVLASFALSAQAQTDSFTSTILNTHPGNLQAYWRCNETSGAVLADSSGNSNNLTISGAQGTNYFFEHGEQGGCLRTDGVAGYAFRNDGVLPTIDNTNFTVYALVKGGADFNSGSAVSIINSANEKSMVQVGNNRSGPLSDAQAKARGNAITDFGRPVHGGTAFDGTWHSLTWRRAGTVFTLFVDGVSVATRTATLTLGGSLNRTSLMHTLNPGCCPTGTYAKGSIQHAAIWNVALSDAEITAIQAARNGAPTPTPTPVVTATPTPTPPGQINVTTEHGDAQRTGMYVDPVFTRTAAANIHRDLGFDGHISGNVFAQPLYIEGGAGPMIIAVTERNDVYALNATTGTQIWHRNVGPPVSQGLPCGNINPLGITGTPVVDLPSRSLFFDSMQGGGVPAHHLIYALNVDTGGIKPGWPVDVNAKVAGFDSTVQNQRGGLGIVGGILYVAYSSHIGDCGQYYGWFLGIPINDPTTVTAWKPSAEHGGGIWGHGGSAGIGNDVIVATGNTYNANNVWGGGESLIRFHPGPVFSGSTTDYWAPTNWQTLDDTDKDLGGTSPVVLTVAGATPSQLVLAMGKDGKAYLVPLNNLGGVSAPVASAQISTSNKGSGAVYTTPSGTYFVVRNGLTGEVITSKITATSPPTIVPAWSSSQTGSGSPWVTTTDGTNNAIVWAVNTAAGDQRLRGFDGDTGAVIFSGGGTNDQMSGTSRFNTGIVARGRIYFAGLNKVYAFTLQ